MGIASFYSKPIPQPMKKSPILLLVLLLPLCLQAQGKRIYVNPTATGGNNGTNWQNALVSLKLALIYAQPGDTVWAATGVYKPTTDNNRTRRFELKNRVCLYGGFAGTETNINQRDLAQNQSILSGDIGVPLDSTDNAFTILYMNNPDTGTVVDGIRFEFGIANDQSDSLGAYALIPGKCGGAVFIEANGGIGYPDFINCTFYRNYALYNGGAIYVYGDETGSVAPRFINCQFIENTAGYSGGAVNRYGGSKLERYPDLSNCRFTRNKASAIFGAFSWTDGPGTDSLQMEDCIFEQNSGNIFISLGNPAGLRCSFDRLQILDGKGGIEVYGFSTKWIDYIRVRNCLFSGNLGTAFSASSNTTLPVGKTNQLLIDQCHFEYSGGLSSSEALVFGFGFSSVKITNCDFLQNQSSSLLMFQATGKLLNIENCRIAYNNTARIRALSSPNVVVKLRNLLFERNLLTDNGTYFDGESGAFSIPFDIQNCTFVRNRVISSNQLQTKRNLLTFKNCAFWNNVNYDSHIFKQHTNGVDFQNCFFDTLNVATLPTNHHLLGQNIIGGDPLFINPVQNGGNYRLQGCSPLINSGSTLGWEPVPFDLDGNDRIQGQLIDIGAYETPAFKFSSGRLIVQPCVDSAQGNVQFFPENGCPPYQFAWQKGSESGTETNNLDPGLYQFTITDARGNTLYDTLTVPYLIKATANALPVICTNGQAGSVQAQAIFGNQPYTYLWNNGQLGSAISPIGPGVYSVTITDANGCSDSASAVVTLGGTLQLVPNIQNPECTGYDNGALSIRTEPPNPLVTYQWNNGSTNAALLGLSAGVYAVTATGAYGCTAILENLQLIDPDPITFQLGMQAASGPLNGDGTLWVENITGGTAPYYFEWNNGIKKDSLQGFLPGDYSVTVTDKNGCTAVADTILEFYVGTKGPAAQEINLDLYPNPAVSSAVLTITTEYPDAISAFLTDMNGQNSIQLLPNTTTATKISFEIPVLNLPAGVYMINIQSGYLNRHLPLCVLRK